MNPIHYDLVIVGAGISGLSLAYRLSRTQPGMRILLLEARSTVGGNLRTEHTADGFLIDAGPDSWVAQKPQATRLAEELGLGSSLIGSNPDTRKVHIVHQGKLHPMPEGLVLGVPTAVRPIIETSLFSWSGKMRMGLELMVPPKNDDEDETVENFITRRLGAEVCERLAGPLLGGIFSGEPSELSMRTCFPSLLEAERKHGSLIRAMRARKAGGSGNASAFTTLRDGVGSLTEALHQALLAAGVHVQTGVQAEGVDSAHGRHVLSVSNGARVSSPALVFAGPAHVPARLLGDDVKHAFSMFRYASAATVFLAYDEAALGRQLDGVGFVVPKSEARSVTACTWVSSKWEGRAPAGKALVRLFFGGTHGQHWLSRSDEELQQIAAQEFEFFVGANARPLFAKTYRFVQGTPQAPFGHLDRVARLRAQIAARYPGIHVLGNGYDGTGIPDCVRQAEQLAARLVASAF